MAQAGFSSSGSGRIDAGGLMNKSRGAVNSNLISILHDIQAKYGYIPEAKIREVAQRLKIPLVDVYGVVTFYKSFSLAPRGRHSITVCLGTACHVRGGPRVMQRISEILRIEPRETTEDQEFSLETVNCLGCCALGPMVVVDGKHHGLMNSAKVGILLRNYKNTKNKVNTGRSSSKVPSSRTLNQMEKDYHGEESVFLT